MTRGIALVLAVLLGTSVAQASHRRRGSDPAERGPIILCYHHVGEHSNSEHALSRATFTRQMRYLKENGYNVISLATLHDYLTGRVIGPLPANSVVVTVDDGWKSTLTEILPIMRRFDFPFTAFIYPKFINGGGSSLSWSEVRELVKAGVDVQSHTVSHAFLTRGRQAWRRAGRLGYDAWLMRELRESRDIISRETGRPVRFLAYPYGDYDTVVAQAAAAAGYAAAVTCNEGPIVGGADPFRLRRFAIDRATTMQQFAKYVGRSGAPVTLPSVKQPTILLAKKAAPRPRREAKPQVQLASVAAPATPMSALLALFHVERQQAMARPMKAKTKKAALRKKRTSSRPQAKPMKAVMRAVTDAGHRPERTRALYASEAALLPSRRDQEPEDAEEES